MSSFPLPQTVTNPALGSDLSCILDLTPQMATVAGRRLLAEALARRLVTQRGTLIDDPTYGFDLTALLNDDVDVAALPRIAAQVKAEWAKDERVVTSVVTVTFLDGVMTVSGVVTDGNGPFKLVIAISEVTVTLLQAGP